MIRPCLERLSPIRPDKLQRVYRFANGYGANVYSNSEGRWELTAIEFYGESIWSWMIDFCNPVAKDVVKNLTDDDLQKLLSRIKSL